MATKTFFTDYAKALLTYDPAEIASYYQAPLAVYSDNGVLLVQKQDEVTNWWNGGVKPYEKMGIKKTVPEVVSEDAVTKNITIATVKWTNYDENNKEIASETNLYILGNTGKGMKIIGLVVTM